MAKGKANTNKQQVIEEEFVLLLNTLQGLVSVLQSTVISELKNGSMSAEGAGKLLKNLSDVLDRIYKIRHGKAARDEIMRKIADIQLHVMKAEQRNAERERRMRENPRLNVTGRLIDEKEIIIKEEDIIIGSEKSDGVSD